MFDRFKKFGAISDRGQGQSNGAAGTDAVSRWASGQGFTYSGPAKGVGFCLSGSMGGRPWKLERSIASRDFFKGDEIRARAELKVLEGVAVIVMNRPLKETLEERAYKIYTDPVQTVAEPSLSEEMRWLALYPEFVWKALPDAFWRRYTVLASHGSDAAAWIPESLVQLLMLLGASDPNAEVPFMLMLLRGKVYLRMQYTPADLQTLQHASAIFVGACESALAGFSGGARL
ncbi:hypothetical protein [Polaromonas sp. UBA4122]|uniref:hypothetical protein n=1 Tax=Polaromonas sp. UBA4122 TaxID=1947074 RepID=UPI0025D47C10|nr:hypothetical protein [Polaromonas sp. UBA4122]